MTEQTENAPAISCKNLSVHAGGARLLDEVSLEIEAREHVLLVGPSGSGKTTLLRAIAGLLVPTGGEISLFGRTASSIGATSIPPENRATQMLFQGGANSKIDKWSSTCFWDGLSVNQKFARTNSLVFLR